MEKKKIILLCILIVSFGISFALPKPKQTTIDISKNIPSSFMGWQSEDISDELKRNNQLDNLIGELFARVYVNEYGESLLFMVLDAGNFHNPKVCYSGAGFDFEELNDIEVNLDGKTVKAQTIYFKNEESNRLLVYWLCVDKKIVGWGQQKIIEFFNSVFNQRKTRLMVRFEVPTDEENIDKSIKLVKSFIHDIYVKFPSQYGQYVFGKI